MWTFGDFLVRADPQDADPVFDDIEALLHEWTTSYTRFDPGSVLERLNDAGGGAVTDELASILALAERAWHDTEGRFDIGLGAELVAEGYDRDADDLPDPTDHDLDPARRLELAREHSTAAARAGADGARAEPPVTFEEDGSVRIRTGSRLDLGGFVKGWAADRTCELLARRLGASCLVNLGGDIAVHVEPGDDAWPIGLHTPQGDASLELSHGGVATSGQEVRLWHVETDDGAGRLGHHIIDPRTGRSAASDISRLTVVSDTCANAEVWSKALLLTGVDRARAEAESRGLMTVIIGLDEQITVAGFD